MQQHTARKDRKWGTAPPPDGTVVVNGRTHVTFEYRQLKRKNRHYRRFLRSKNPLAVALMAKMDYNKKEQVRLKAEFLRLITAANVNDARRSLLFEFIDGYMPLRPEEQHEFHKFVETQSEYEGVTKMITSFERVGLERGLERGLLEGKQDDVILFAEARLGAWSESRKQAIRAVRDVKKLNEMVRLLATAESLNELPL